MYINNPRWAMSLTPTTHFRKEPGGVSIFGAASMGRNAEVVGVRLPLNTIFMSMDICC